MRKAHFESKKADNHLLSLGEFYAMYLFVWSNTVWPAALPTFEGVFPDEAAVIAAGPRLRPPGDFDPVWSGR